MSASMEAAKKPRRTKPKLVVSATTTMAEHGGNLSEAMQAREAAILREQGVTQPWEGDGHMHTGTLADGVGGMQDRELRILMERAPSSCSCRRRSASYGLWRSTRSSTCRTRSRRWRAAA